jgi:hypothetical protein
MNLIVESQYFAPVTLFKKSVQFSNIKFDIYESWRKMSFRNRCVVAGANGPIVLSIPLLEGREQKKMVKEVAIDNRKQWQEQHWKTITSCYNRSPWFDFFGHELEELYRQPVELLAHWNTTCFRWVADKLGLSIDVGYTDRFQPQYLETGEVDWRNRLVPKSINEDFLNPVKYHQVFEDRLGFIPNLSILDLLFCEGKNALQILSFAAGRDV